MIISIASGKGGTGKTTVVGAFSNLAENKVLEDCDVDAADLFLILEPVTNDRGDLFGGRKPVLDRINAQSVGYAPMVGEL